MKRILALAVLLVGAAGFAQPPAEQFKYPRGYAPPKNLAQLKAASFLAHGQELANLPKATEDEYDCSEMLPPVKSQLSCGSCWCFAGTGVCEGAIFKATGKRLVLSEQYTLSCVRGHGGCNGDDYSTVFQHARSHGMPTTEQYGPYEGGTGHCRFHEGMELHSIDDWGFVDGQGDEIADSQSVMNAMKAFGPIGTSVAAGRGWDNYSGGVHRGNNRNINHETIITGWSKKKLPGRVVWKMRNSWGPEWGDGGYMWVEERNDMIGSHAAFAKMKAVPPPPKPPGPEPSNERGLLLIIAAAAVGMMLGLVVAVIIGQIAAKRALKK